MLKDQFGNVIEVGKVYGMGDRRSALVPHDVSFDGETADVIVRRHKSDDPWRRLYDQDSLLPKFCFLLDEDLMEVEYEQEEQEQEAL